MKILITGGKSSTALKVLKAFAQYQVILADYDEVPAFFSKDYRLISLGNKNEDTIAHTTLNYCLNEGVDAILPLQSYEIEAIAKSRILFNEFDIAVLLPDLTELAQYTSDEKTTEWVVFVEGDPIFMTCTNEVVTAIGTQKHLNGAFYFENSSNPKLSLITI